MNKKVPILIILVTMILSSSLIGINSIDGPELRTINEIIPLERLNITEMIIDRLDNRWITVTDSKFIETLLNKLAIIEVKKHPAEQLETFIEYEQAVFIGDSYTIKLQDNLHEVKMYPMLLNLREGKTLLLIDNRSNRKQTLYANTSDQESLEIINEIYRLVAVESGKDFINKAKAKGINEEMLRTLGNLGYSEEEILNLSPEKLKRIFAPGTHLDGGGFSPNEEQETELKKLGIDSDMSAILDNLGYSYEEMLQLSPEEIDFIFPNTELIDNLVKSGYNEQDIQPWVVNGSGKSYKEIIKEALNKLVVQD